MLRNTGETLPGLEFRFLFLSFVIPPARVKVYDDKNGTAKTVKSRLIMSKVTFENTFFTIVLNAASALERSGITIISTGIEISIPGITITNLLLRFLKTVLTETMSLSKLANGSIKLT